MIIELPVVRVNFNGVQVYPGDTVNIRRPGQKYLRCTIIHVGEKKVTVRPSKRVKRADGTFGVQLGAPRKLLREGLEVTAVRPPKASRVEQDPEAISKFQTAREVK
jgi:hypothetical protein